jgi:hypothetical protein
MASQRSPVAQRDPPNRSALDPMEHARRPSCSCSAPGCTKLRQQTGGSKVKFLDVTKKDWISPKRLDYVAKKFGFHPDFINDRISWDVFMGHLIFSFV